MNDERAKRAAEKISAAMETEDGGIPVEETASVIHSEYAYVLAENELLKAASDIERSERRLLVDMAYLLAKRLSAYSGLPERYELKSANDAVLSNRTAAQGSIQ